MGRRKKVDLSKLNPLESVTIGEMKKPKFVLLKTFILIGLFVAVVFYMDDVKYYLDKYVGVYFGISSGTTTGGNNNTTTNNTVTNNTTEEPIEEVDVYEFGKTTEVDYLTKYNIKVSNISLSDNTLTFEITTDDSDYNLGNHKLYFIVYNSDSVATNYYHLTGTVSKDKKLGKVFTTSGGTFYSIKELSEEDYPFYEIVADEGGNSKVNCNNGTENYTYYFKNDKLTKVEFVSSFSNDDPNYDNLKDKYNDLKLNYEDSDGVKTSYDYSESTKTTKFTFNVDYTVTYKKIDGGLFYAIDTKYNVVMFETSSELYTCRAEAVQKK